MAVVCVIPEHPVGEGAFCRICGRSYLTVADPLPDLVVAVSAPLPPLPPTLPPPLPPTLPRPLPLLPEAAAPAETLPDPVIPQQVTSELAADTLPDDTPHKSAPRSLPPSVVHALAGFGGGAVVMAVLDRLLL
jgi:hypothetical protein